MTTQNTTTETRWLTTKQAAAYLQVSLSTLERFKRSGLPFTKVAMTCRFDRLALDTWMQSNTTTIVIGGVK